MEQITPPDPRWLVTETLVVLRAEKAKTVQI